MNLEGGLIIKSIYFMKKTKLVRLNEKNKEDVKRIFFNLTRRLKEIDSKVDDVKLRQVRKQIKKKI